MLLNPKPPPSLPVRPASPLPLFLPAVEIALSACHAASVALCDQWPHSDTLATPTVAAWHKPILLKSMLHNVSMMSTCAALKAKKKPTSLAAHDAFISAGGPALEDCNPFGDGVSTTHHRFNIWLSRILMKLHENTTDALKDCRCSVRRMSTTTSSKHVSVGQSA